MDEWLKNLWNKNKIFFILLLPLILIVVFKDLIISLLVGSARKIANKGKEEAEKFEKEADKANAEADKLKAESDILGERIKSRTEDDIPEDWNKKKE